MESERQRKVASVIQRDLADIFRKSASEYPGKGLIISVSAVKVTVDMAIAKVYLSIFPADEAKSILEGVTSNAPLIKHELAQRTKNQMRRVPELLFYIDDSIELAEKVERSLKGDDNPIEDPSLLVRRKKKVKAAIYIAWRYLFSKSQQSVVNLIAYITLSVIVVATAALLIVLSAFSGLKEYSLSYAEQNSPEYTLVAKQNGVFQITPQQVQRLRNGGVQATPVLKKQAVLQWDENSAIGWFEAYPLDLETTQELLYGIPKPSQDSLLINLALYRQSGLHPDDSRTLSVSIPKRSSSALALGFGSSPLNDIRGIVAGVFQSPEANDTPTVVIEYTSALGLLELKDGWWVTQLNLSNSALDEKDLKALVADVFGDEILLRSRAESNAALFKLLNSEYVATYIIFTLILILALFNLAGALNVILLDKQYQLPVFKQLGMTPAAIRMVFFLLGWFQVVFGTAIGIVIGVVVVWLQALFGWVKVAPNLAYPVSLDLSQIGLVVITLLVLGAISSSVALVVATPLRRR